jgi:hypothetical protein
MVVDRINHLLAMLANRDILLAQLCDVPLSQMITPIGRLVVVSQDDTLEETRRKLCKDHVK